MCALFLDVFVNFGIISDHLGVCFDRGNLVWGGGSVYLRKERSRGMHTVGRNANT